MSISPPMPTFNLKIDQSLTQMFLFSNCIVSSETAVSFCWMNGRSESFSVNIHPAEVTPKRWIHPSQQQRCCVVSGPALSTNLSGASVGKNCPHVGLISHRCPTHVNLTFIFTDSAELNLCTYKNVPLRRVMLQKVCICKRKYKKSFWLDPNIFEDFVMADSC